LIKLKNWENNKSILLPKVALGYRKVFFLLLKLNFSNKKNKKLKKSYPNVEWQKATFSQLAAKCVAFSSYFLYRSEGEMQNKKLEIAKLVARISNKAFRF
jgi:hypothetical protein